MPTVGIPPQKPSEALIFTLFCYDWIVTKLFPPTLLAYFATPDLAKLFQRSIPIPLSSVKMTTSKLCLFSFLIPIPPLKVCATNKNSFAIKDYHLEMHTRAKNSLQAIKENRVFIKIFPECRAWFFGMNKLDYSYPFSVEEKESSRILQTSS